ncbi:glucuronate isomerase, partial [Salmonella enterica]|nr:glucuronate isomerase [Salmonella enterica]EJD2376383.1 glucuronate isomerase [Salmonella enterica]
MDFITDRFMIDSEVGVRLYKEVAAKLPIIDYHCHLDAKEIYENKKFDNITQL